MKIKYEYLPLITPREVEKWLFDNAYNLDHETKIAIFSLMHYVNIVGAFFDEHEDELDKFIAFSKEETDEETKYH